MAGIVAALGDSPADLGRYGESEVVMAARAVAEDLPTVTTVTPEGERVTDPSFRFLPFRVGLSTPIKGFLPFAEKLGRSFEKWGYPALFFDLQTVMLPSPSGGVEVPFPIDNLSFPDLTELKMRQEATVVDMGVVVHGRGIHLAISGDLHLDFRLPLTFPDAYIDLTLNSDPNTGEDPEWTGDLTVATDLQPTYLGVLTTFRPKFNFVLRPDEWWSHPAVKDLALYGHYYGSDSYALDLDICGEQIHINSTIQGEEVIFQVEGESQPNTITLDPESACLAIPSQFLYRAPELGGKLVKGFGDGKVAFMIGGGYKFMADKAGNTANIPFPDSLTGTVEGTAMTPEGEVIGNYTITYAIKSADQDGEALYRNVPFVTAGVAANLARLGPGDLFLLADAGYEPTFIVGHTENNHEMDADKYEGHLRLGWDGKIGTFQFRPFLEARAALHILGEPGVPGSYTYSSTVGSAAMNEQLGSGWGYQRQFGGGLTIRK